MDLNSTNALMSSIGSFFCNDLTNNQGCMFNWKINKLPFLNISHLFLWVIALREINDFQGVNIWILFKNLLNNFSVFPQNIQFYHFYSKKYLPLPTSTFILILYIHMLVMGFLRQNTIFVPDTTAYLSFLCIYIDVE